MEATYIRVMAHVKPERVRQKMVPRGLNRHQGGSVLFYARVFPCTRLPQILRTRSLYRGPRFNAHMCVCVCVCVARASARLNLATCSFSMLDTLSLLPIPANSARSYDFFSSPRLSFSPSLHSLKAITSFSPFSPPFPLLFFLYTLFLLSNLANNKKLVQWPSRFSLSDSSSRFFLRDIEFQRIFPSVFSPRFLCFWIRQRKFHYATRWSELFASIYLACTSASSQILPRSSRWFFSLLD